MRQAVIAMFSALALLVTGACGETEGTTYEAPVEKVYEKLSTLEIGSDLSTPTSSRGAGYSPATLEENKVVAWDVGGEHGSHVVARLTPINATQTNVVVDVNFPAESVASVPVPLQNMLKNMIRERIAAHLEDRPYNSEKFKNALSGGGLIPRNTPDTGVIVRHDNSAMRGLPPEAEQQIGIAVQNERPLNWGEPVQTAPNALR